MELKTRKGKKETKTDSKNDAWERKRKIDSDSGPSKRRHRDREEDTKSQSESTDTENGNTDSDSEPSQKRHRKRNTNKRSRRESRDKGKRKKEATDSSSYSTSKDSEEYKVESENEESESDSEEREKHYKHKARGKKKSKTEVKKKQGRSKKEKSPKSQGSGIYRCHLPTAITDLQKLKFKEVHLEVIKKTPFWMLFNALYKCNSNDLKARCGKHFDDINDIIDAYEKDSRSFKIGGKNVELDEKDVELILGISGGINPISLRTNGFVATSWVRRCFDSELRRRKGKLIITKASTLNKLNEMIAKKEDVNLLDVARLVHCYLMTSIIAPLTNGSMAPRYTMYLEKFSDICDYNWGEFIVSMLKKQMTSGKTKRVGGCTILLPYWLCEHTTLVKPVDQLAFPRFLRWDLRDLNKKLSKDRKKLEVLNKKYVKRHALKSTDEEKELLTSLKRFWLSEGKATQNETISESESQENDDSSTDQGTPNPKYHETGSEGDDDEVVEATISIGTATPKNIQTDSSAKKRDKDRRNTIDRDSGSKHTNTMRSLKAKNMDQEKSLDCSTDASEQKQEMSQPNIVQVVDSIDKQQLAKENESRMKMDSHMCPTMPEKMFSLGIPKTPVPAQPEKDDENCNKEQVEEAVDFAVGYGVTELEKELFEARKMIENKKAEMEKKDKKLEESKKIIKAKGEIITKLNSEIEKMRDIARDRDEKVKVIDYLKEQVLKYQKSKQEDFNNRMRSYIEDKVEESRKMLTAEYEAKLKESRDETAALREENKCLKERFTNPTTTQLLDNPETLERLDTLADLKAVRREKDQLAEKNQLLEETMEDVLEVEMYNADGVCMMPGFEEKLEEPPNSIVKHVKARTKEDDRKVKVVSPQPTSAEIIDLQKIGDEHNVEPAEVFRWDEKFYAVVNTRPHFKEYIKECYKIEGYRYAAWTGKPDWIMVNIKDIFHILHHERLSDQVIDCWAQLLKIVSEKVIPESRRVIIVSGKCWDLVENKDNTSKTYETLVTSKSDEVEDNGVILIPMLAKGHRIGNHWTLLRLDLSVCEWTYFNPMRPRRGTDRYLNCSIFLLDHVEHYLRERFRVVYPNHKLLDGPLKKPKSSAYLQQKAGSLDCGVVICNHIEKIILNKEIETGELTEDEAGDFRKKMVEYFLEPLEIVIDK